MRRCKGVLLAGMLVLSMSVPVYADKSVVVKVEAPADTTDYYMTVDSGGVGVDIYPSTDEKGEKLNDKTVKDGTVLHIEGETEKNGETWGYTEYFVSSTSTLSSVLAAVNAQRTVRQVRSQVRSNIHITLTMISVSSAVHVRTTVTLMQYMWKHRREDTLWAI